MTVIVGSGIIDLITQRKAAPRWVEPVGSCRQQLRPCPRSWVTVRKPECSRQGEGTVTGAACLQGEIVPICPQMITRVFCWAASGEQSSHLGWFRWYFIAAVFTVRFPSHGEETGTFPRPQRKWFTKPAQEGPPCSSWRKTRSPSRVKMKLLMDESFWFQSWALFACGSFAQDSLVPASKEGGCPAWSVLPTHSPLTS